MVFPLIVVPHHLHRCPGDLHAGAIKQKHDAHIWRCFNPNCGEAPEYLCGLFADFLAWRDENLRKAREEQKRIRMSKGGAF